MRVVQRFGLERAIALVCLACCGAWLDAADQGAAMLPTFASIERLDPRLDALMPPDARIFSEPGGCVRHARLAAQRVHS